MLDKKQLEKIMVWEQEPLTMIGVYAKEAAKTALAYREMLERLEWIMTRDTCAGEWVEWCPECENRKTDGHKPNCELAALLKGE